MSDAPTPKRPRRKRTKGGPSPNPGGKRKRPAATPEKPKPVDAGPENIGRNPDGTFTKGNSANPAGKPKGARHKTTLAMEALLEGEADAITRKAIELAKDGDLIAIRICMDRLLPPRRDRSVAIAMPKIEKASDLVSAAAALTEATATGELTPGEASDLGRLVEVTAKAIEMNSLAERIERLEQQLSKGSNP